MSIYSKSYVQYRRWDENLMSGWTAVFSLAGEQWEFEVNQSHYYPTYCTPLETT